MYIKKENPFTGQHKNSKYDPKEASINGLYNRTKQQAKHRKISWDLSKEAFTKLIFSPCVWCGREPFEKYNVAISKNGYTQLKYQSKRITDGWIIWNGIDRIDSSKPYMEGNVQACCKHCNFAKNSRTDEEFISWIKLLAIRWNK